MSESSPLITKRELFAQGHFKVGASTGFALLFRRKNFRVLPVTSDLLKLWRKQDVANCDSDWRVYREREKSSINSLFQGPVTCCTSNLSKLSELTPYLGIRVRLVWLVWSAAQGMIPNLLVVEWAEVMGRMTTLRIEVNFRKPTWADGREGSSTLIESSWVTLYSIPIGYRIGLRIFWFWLPTDNFLGNLMAIVGQGFKIGR